MAASALRPLNALVHGCRVGCHRDHVLQFAKSKFRRSNFPSSSKLNNHLSTPRQWGSPLSLIPICRPLSSNAASVGNDKKEVGIGRRRLDVAIVGAPNAGKSQLLNVLANSSVAAVSRKRHTTRNGIMAVRTVGDTQIVFKDTPGFLQLEHAKSERLERDLIATAASEMKNVDYTLLVVDAARTLTDNYREALVSLMLHAIHSEGRVEDEGDYDSEDATSNSQEEPIDLNRSKFAIVLNKVDIVKPKSMLLDIAMEIGSMADECIRRVYRGPKADNQDVDKTAEESDDMLEILLRVGPVVFYVSALKRENTDDLLQHLLKLSTPCKEWALPENETTDMHPQERVQEIIREKIYRCTHRELPHSVAQVNRLFRQVNHGMVIHQDLVVFTKSHQKLLLGSGGRTLQRIEETACRDLQEMFKCNVALKLHVKLNKSQQRQQDIGEFSREDMAIAVDTPP